MKGDENYYQEEAPYSSGESNSADAAFINEESSSSVNRRPRETPRDGNNLGNAAMEWDPVGHHSTPWLPGNFTIKKS